MKWIIRHRAPVLLVIDYISFMLAYLLVHELRYSSGLFDNPIEASIQDALRNAAVTSFYWLVVFVFRGMYAHKLSTSRYEAFVEVGKTTTLGTVIIFFLLLFPSPIITSGKLILLSYGGLIFFFSATGRILFRNVIRACFHRGIGKYQAIIVGFGKRGQKLYRTLTDVPEFGYEIVGIVCSEENDNVPRGIENAPLQDFEKLMNIERNDPIEIVLISMEPSDRDTILSVIDRVSRYPVRIMIIPDFYQILVGLARSQQLYGVPLIEMFPSLISPVYSVFKRVVDIVISLMVFLVGWWFFLIVGILIRLDSKGPALYRQKRVGYRGKEFTLYKFRTMVQDAEKKTGAVWATENDPRITRLGKFLRVSRIDEFPQLWNVLIGDMTLVGPRPERKVFVDQFAKTIPFYSRRLNAKPGITGWAQIRRGYDTDVEGVREKLQFDLFYLENVSLSLDLKIVMNTFWVML
ncbi:sugar transferase, partial [bacterium]|nr:sugar transferase [bacterium]